MYNDRGSPLHGFLYHSQPKYLPLWPRNTYMLWSSIPIQMRKCNPSRIKSKTSVFFSQFHGESEPYDPLFSIGFSSWCALYVLKKKYHSQIRKHNKNNWKWWISQLQTAKKKSPKIPGPWASRMRHWDVQTHQKFSSEKFYVPPISLLNFQAYA